MKKGLSIKLTIILLLTGMLTAFFYVHETFPKPIRAATALLGTPTAIASGLSYYLNLGIPVYETPWAVVFSNLIASIIIVILSNTFLEWRRKRKELS
ncbi:MAG: hypothetical protein ACOH2D_14820 [Gelidibacter sp.]|uniref:hypothetical protein n=1 Tax=Gelidibacter sp. TaxID=2018083 RepID=UPI00326304B5